MYDYSLLQQQHPVFKQFNLQDLQRRTMLQRLRTSFVIIPPGAKYPLYSHITTFPWSVCHNYKYLRVAENTRLSLAAERIFLKSNSMPTWYDNAVNNGLTESPTIYLPYDTKFMAP